MRASATALTRPPRNTRRKTNREEVLVVTLDKNEEGIGCIGIRYLDTLIKGSLDEKLPIYEQDPKSKRLDSFEKRFVRD